MSGFFSKLGKKADELAAAAAEKASELKEAASEKIEEVVKDKTYFFDTNKAKEFDWNYDAFYGTKDEIFEHLKNIGVVYEPPSTEEQE
jgi:enamine deaminase RidA (YjgF/YER057c/UK114 family)